tara:strand:- start:990 stop:1367 length:378 start_codon:yes stop_codon:yes gene_type:complete
MPYVIEYQLENINASLQIGDAVYYTSSIQVGNNPNFFNINNNTYSDIVKIGTISFINRSTNKIRISGSANVNLPDNNNFLFFTKDNARNLSSIKGYYAELKMVNNNNDSRSELFQISLSADESSK